MKECKKIGMPLVKGEQNLPFLIGIGLTDVKNVLLVKIVFTRLQTHTKSGLQGIPCKSIFPGKNLCACARARQAKIRSRCKDTFKEGLFYIRSMVHGYTIYKIFIKPIKYSC